MGRYDIYLQRKVSQWHYEQPPKYGSDLYTEISDVNARYKASIPMDHFHGKLSQFLTFNFDDSGTVLYAWANRHIHGVLFAYKFTDGLIQSPDIIERKFKVRQLRLSTQQMVCIFQLTQQQEDYSERRHKCLIPMTDQEECIVVAGSELFLGCVNDDRQKAMLNSTRAVGDSNSWVPQPTLEPETGSEPLAVCVIGDSLIVYQLTRQGLFRTRKVVQVCQRILNVRRTIDLIPPKILAAWKPEHSPAKSPINTDIKMAAVDLDEGSKTQFCLVISHRSGIVEIVC